MQRGKLQYSPGSRDKGTRGHVNARITIRIDGDLAFRRGSQMTPKHAPRQHGARGSTFAISISIERPEHRGDSPWRPPWARFNHVLSLAHFHQVAAAGLDETRCTAAQRSCHFRVSKDR